jgi:hypothetical protein
MDFKAVVIHDICGHNWMPQVQRYTIWCIIQLYLERKYFKLVVNGS